MSQNEIYYRHRVLRTHNSHMFSTNFEVVLLKRCNPRRSCSLQIHYFLASNVQAVLCHLSSKSSTHRVVKRLIQLEVLSHLFSIYGSVRPQTQFWFLPGWYACVCLCNTVQFHLANACESNCDPICHKRTHHLTTVSSQRSKASCWSH